MNHIYKVIFNKATGTFMAVAEYAKSHSTGGSCATGQVGSVCTLSFARVAALAVLVIGATLNGSAYAQQHKIEIGQSGGLKGTAKAIGNRAIAVGEYSNAEGDQAIAIGSSDKTNERANDPNIGNHAKGHESIAIGGDVVATGDASIAIGSDDLHLTDGAGNSSSSGRQIQNLIEQHPELKKIRDGQNNSVRFARTHAQGHASIAVGAMTQAIGHFANAFGTRAIANGPYSLAVGLLSKAEKGYAIAIGSNAQASEYRTLALGADTKVELNRGVAIGYGSQILTTDIETGAYKPGNNLSIDAQATKPNNTGEDIFSIGKQGLRRRIIHVGAGSQDTDAVNVAQLKAAVELAEREITFQGDDDSTGVKKKLGQTLTIKGGQTETSNLTEGNISVVKDNSNGGGLKVQLAKTLNNLTKVNTTTLDATTNVKVGSNGTTAELLNGGLTFTRPSTGGANTGKTIYGHDGVKFINDNTSTATEGTTRIDKDKIGFAGPGDAVDTNSPYLDKKQLQVGSVIIDKDSGINAGNTKITKLADGVADDHAVTIKQLKAAKPTLKAGGGIDITDTSDLLVNANANGDVTPPILYHQGENC